MNHHGRVPAAHHPSFAKDQARIADAYFVQVCARLAWPRCVLMLERAGYSALDIPKIMRSRITRWVAEQTRHRSPSTSANFLRFMANAEIAAQAAAVCSASASNMDGLRIHEKVGYTAEVATLVSKAFLSVPRCTQPRAWSPQLPLRVGGGRSAHPLRRGRAVSRDQFDDDCPGCRPAMLNVKTGRTYADDSPTMVIVNRLWRETSLAERQATKWALTG